MNADVRERVLAEWRGFHAHPARRDRVEPMASHVGKLMRTLGLSDRLRESEVQGAWREIVGEFIAEHSAPARLKEGILYVHVLQSTLHYELDRVWKPQIIKKLRERFGARSIRDVKFRLG